MPEEKNQCEDPGKNILGRRNGKAKFCKERN